VRSTVSSVGYSVPTRLKGEASSSSRIALEIVDFLTLGSAFSSRLFILILSRRNSPFRSTILVALVSISSAILSLFLYRLSRLVPISTLLSGA